MTEKRLYSSDQLALRLGGFCGMAAVIVLSLGSVGIADTTTVVAEDWQGTPTITWVDSLSVQYDYSADVLRPAGETYDNKGMRVRYGGSTKAIIGTFGETVSLGSQVGDAIALTFDFAYYGVAEADLRFGLFNSNSTPGLWTDLDGDGDNENSQSDDFGYYAAFGTGTDSGATANMETGDGGDWDYIARNEGDDVIDLATSMQVPTINLLETKYSASLTLTRTAGGTDMLVEIFDANGTRIGYASGTDASSTHTTFDEIVFGMNSNNSELRMDNVELTNTVPEPAALTLLAAGGLLALRRRRR